MSINWDYVIERVDRYHASPDDDLLYRIGSHVDVLRVEDINLIHEQNGYLNPEQRYRVLNWIAEQGLLNIQTDLALLIFGRDQLSEWLERSRQAYPNFEFYLLFEAHDGQYTGNHGIDCAMYWMPNPGAPQPDVQCDFSWKLSWEWGEMFWGNYPGGFTNQFDFHLDVYPNQQGFIAPGFFCKEGDSEALLRSADRYCTPDEEEAQMMSVAEVLKATQVAA